MYEFRTAMERGRIKQKVLIQIPSHFPCSPPLSIAVQTCHLIVRLWAMESGPGGEEQPAYFLMKNCGGLTRP